MRSSARSPARHCGRGPPTGGSSSATRTPTGTYGGADGIRLAEQLFHADSDATLAIIDGLDPGDTGLDQRWRLALRGMHALLADFALELRARVALLRELRDAPGGEMPIERAQKRQLRDTYRNERTGLARLLAPSIDAGDALAPGFAALRRRSERLRSIVADLGACEAAGRLTSPLGTIVASYLHMHANRLLRSAMPRP